MHLQRKYITDGESLEYELVQSLQRIMESCFRRMKRMRQISYEKVKEWFPLICGVFYLSGMTGFIYETIFYLINNGAWTRRGTCFGPWIQIYGMGGVMILLLLYRMRRNPWLVFFLSGLVAGVMEFIAGYFMYHFMNGLRTWDYNTEIWNWGNIGGYVCFRSILVFALAGILLIYLVLPILQFIKKRMNPRLFLLIMVIPAMVFLVDIVYNDILAKFLPLMDSYTFYMNTGWYEIVNH